MKILITGAKGFVGRNLTENLKCVRDGKDKTRGISDIEIFEYDVDTDPRLLSGYAAECDFVFHLAGVNRPKDENEFMEGNFGFTSELLKALEKHENKAPVLITSSIQAELDNPYGISKKAGEDLILEYGKKHNIKTFVYRLPNVFGKWCRPNYNSAVATFCHNIANGLPIKVNDRSHMMTLVYIDDVIDELISALKGSENRRGAYCYVPAEHKITLGEIADMLYGFKAARDNLLAPDVSEGSFSKKLYSTYLSYLPPEAFTQKLNSHRDDRGSFTELLHTSGAGQFSVNISKPGVTKGHHWHNTKTEKFVVVKGHGVIQLRQIGSKDIINIEVNGDDMTSVDMIPGYTHNIVNLSDTEELITFMWANETFNPDKPDTFRENVSE